LDFSVALFLMMQVVLGQGSILFPGHHHLMHDGCITVLLFLSAAGLALRSRLSVAFQVAVTGLVVVSAGFLIANEHRFHQKTACNHRTLILTYGNAGIAFAVLAAHVVGPDAASTWLRRFVMVFCALTYVNAGMAKTLNPPTWSSWASGATLQSHLSNQFSLYCKWHWLGSLLLQHPYLIRYMAVMSLTFESFISGFVLCCASRGTGLWSDKVGSFWRNVYQVLTGSLGIISAAWVWLAVMFHVGIFLLMAPTYNLQMYVLLILVLDLPVSLWMLAFSQRARSDQGVTALSWASRPVRFVLACVPTMLAIAWIAVGLWDHFPNDDPKWPITSFPMYSLPGCVCSCPESMRHIAPMA